MRKDHDLLGDILIPDEVYYGAQTQRALELCNPSKEKLSDYPELIYSLAAIKKACALAHKELRVLAEDKADAIAAAADEVMSQKFGPEEFPVDIVNGGGGVSVHMNINEVLATRATELLSGNKVSGTVHANTHVNMGQSTNDVLPAAMKLALYLDLKTLIGQVETLRNSFDVKAKEFAHVVKVSRTCIQDAVPITLGQFYGAAVSFLARQQKELEALLPECLQIPLGATAVGTGLNAFYGSVEKIMPKLSGIFGVEISQEGNLFDGLQFGDLYLKASGVLTSIATGVSKMGRDLRLMSSGPRSGFQEITIAPVQNGSSIMPGKVNPALPELMNVVCYQICGNNVSVTMAVEGGELELNVWEPVIIVNLLGSCKLLTNTLGIFAHQCVDTIQANKAICLRDAEASLASAAVVSAVVGYQKGTMVAELAAKEDLSIKEAAVRLGALSAEQAEKLLDPVMLTDPEQSGKLLLDLALAQHRCD